MPSPDPQSVLRALADGALSERGLASRLPGRLTPETVRPTAIALEHVSQIERCRDGWTLTAEGRLVLDR